MADFEMQDFVATMNLGTIATGTLGGAITGIRVQEDDGTGFKNNTVIRSDRPSQIVVSWELFGTKLDSPFLKIDGNWVVKAYLEGWGAAAIDHDLDPKTVSVMGKRIMGNKSSVRSHSTETAWQYEADIPILPSTSAPTAGAYRLAVTVTYEDSAGAPGDMAGFIEFHHMIQIYDPKP